MKLEKKLVSSGYWLFRWRSYFPIVIILFFIPAMVEYEYVGGSREMTTTWGLFCLIVGLLGLLFRIMVVGHTPQNTSGRNTREQIAEVLNTSGWYSVVRHPLYLGNYTMGLGISLFPYSWWMPVIYTLAFTLYYERIMVAEEDFYDKNWGAIKGYSLYLDAETKRKNLKYNYGISDSLEFKFEIPFLSFDGGFMDSSIESVHSLIGVSNFKQGGAYRALSERNKYDYYVVKDGEFVYASNQIIYNIRGEPSMGLKWNLSEGGNVMPAVTVKFSYKFANSDRSGEQKLVRTGGVDWGHYLILSKGFNKWIVYFGDGKTRIGQNLGFVSSMNHQFMSLEYRIEEEESFVFQTVSQSSIFPETAANSRSTVGDNQGQRNSNLSVATSVSAFGYKYFSGPIFWETGFVQDYNNFGNETDFVLFWEMGVHW